MKRIAYLSARRALVVGALVVVAAAAVAAVGVVAYAQADGDNVIHACYDNTNGSMRFYDPADVDGPKPCKGHETALEWNAEGPQGVQGPPGLSGYVRVFANTAFNGDDMKHGTAICPLGTRVLGGGAIIGSPPGHHQIGVFTDDNFPLPGQEAWTVGAHESVENGAVWGLSVYAICAQVAG